MTWKERRKAMDEVLKSKVVPELRKMGFKGSLPHFKRTQNGLIQILGFQFSQWGPQFYICIAAAPAEGVTMLNGKHYPGDKIKYYQCNAQSRIGQNPFDFEKNDPGLVAEKVLASLPEGELWWRSAKV